MKDKKSYAGHRGRVREKILASPSLEAFQDYELVEFLLFSCLPRKDVKPLAKKLLDSFGGLAGLINADKDKFLEIDGVTENIFAQFYVIKESIRRVLSRKVMNKNIIGSWDDLLEYLKTVMGDLKIEQFRVLFLNKKNALIADEIMGNGTIDQTPVYPREIVKKALFYEAGAVLLVHNHPSGGSKPSKADIDLTKRIVEICSSVNVTVHDHVIIAGREYFSFKSNLLL